MRKPAAKHHRAHASLHGRRGARWPREGNPAMPPYGPREAGRQRAADASAAGVSAVPGRVPELVFTPVRPGFAAPCMVEAAGTGDSRRVGRGGTCGRRPGRSLPHWRAARGRRGESLPARLRRAGRRWPPARAPHNAADTSKRTNGTFFPGYGKPSRRCSAQRGYHSVRACRDRGPGIDYFG